MDLRESKELIIQIGGFMLILTRRIGEIIVIGDNIKVTILNIKGGQIRAYSGQIDR